MSVSCLCVCSFLGRSHLEYGGTSQRILSNDDLCLLIVVLKIL